MRWTKRNGVRVTLAAVLAASAGIALLAASSGSAASAAKPANQDPPTISGKTEVGVTLVASAGAWTNDPTGYDYQWRRCDQNGNSCSSISGATGKEYLLKPVDRENTLRIRVTARNADGSTTSTWYRPRS
jgi:hypothetical protein